MLTQWYLPPPLTDTVKSSLFTHVNSSPLSLAVRLHQYNPNHLIILTMVALFPERPHISASAGSAFIRKTCWYRSNSNCKSPLLLPLGLFAVWGSGQQSGRIERTSTQWGIPWPMDYVALNSMIRGSTNPFSGGVRDWDIVPLQYVRTLAPALLCFFSLYSCV